MLIEFTYFDGRKISFESSSIEAIYQDNAAGGDTFVIAGSDYHQLQDKYEDVVDRVKKANRKPFITLTAWYDRAKLFIRADDIVSVGHDPADERTEVTTTAGAIHTVLESPEAVMNLIDGALSE